MRHPSETNLALWAGKDLGGWAQWRIGRHIQRCPACRAEAMGFATGRDCLAEEGQRLPAGVPWERLALEMRANIRVGLAAGECVAPPRAMPASLGWPAAVALAFVMGVVLTGWFYRVPSLRSPHRVPALSAENMDGSVQRTREGITLRQGDRVLTMRFPAPAQTAVYLSEPTALRARYVDTDTGQITINKVYVE